MNITVNWLNILNTVVDGVALAVGWITTILIVIMLFKYLVYDKEIINVECFMCKAKLNKKTDNICTVSVNNKEITFCESCGVKFLEYRLKVASELPKSEKQTETETVIEGN